MSAAPANTTTELPATAPADADKHGPTSHDHGFVPVQTRSERFSSTDVTAFAEVTGREVEWKQTPVRELRDLIDGQLDGSPISMDVSERPGFTSAWVTREDERIGAAGTPEDRASANAWSSFEQALIVRASTEEPKEFYVFRDGRDSTPRAAHTVIVADPNSHSTVLLRSTGAGRVAENVEIVVGDGAHLTVISVQRWNDDAAHLATHYATVGRDATLRHIVISLGGDIVRVNPSIHLDGEGASVEAYGLYFADAGQHLESRVYIDHQAPQTRSRVKYKGALQGDGAHAVWIGDVLIRQSAVGTDSYEENRNLVLTEGTRADSIPNLEIETGDIQGAGHASSTGRFDDEQLFYLQSRGISEAEARRMVVRGFLTEIVQQIGSPALEAELLATIDEELAGNSR